MKEILQFLFDHKTLTREDARLVLTNIASGKYNDPEIAAFVSVYLMRSITVDELRGFRDALLDLCIPIDLSEYNTIDLCGTGGDKLDLFNVSTTSVFVLAACGAAVVKHGNRGITSKSGGADVLEALGIRIDLPPESFGDCIAEVGAGFLFADILQTRP